MTARQSTKLHAERIAVLETKMAEVHANQTAMLAKQDEILTELARYRGALGMALLIASAVGTALVFFKDAVLAKFGTKP